MRRTGYGRNSSVRDAISRPSRTTVMPALNLKEYIPDAVQVYDHFLIVKLMWYTVGSADNDKLDNVRCDTYNQEADENKRCLIKGQRWLLFANGDNLSPKVEESGKLESINNKIKTTKRKHTNTGTWTSLD